MTSQPSAPFTIWYVSDGRRGIENQARGLAEAVARQRSASNAPVQLHPVIVRTDGFVTLPDSPQPDLWIGCGRAAIPLVRKHRRLFARCIFVYVQDPRQRHGDFDLIIAPEHDGLRRANAISMIGSPNRIDPARLKADAAKFADKIAALPARRAAVLIGGDSKRFRLSPAIATYLADRLAALAAQSVGLMVTVSRRTPDSARKLLHDRLGDHPGVWFHDGEGENPYFAFLEAADWIFVTEESTNMLVEAASTGKPLYILPMDGDPGKFAQLQARLIALGIARPYLGVLESWQYTPLTETDRVAGLLNQLLLTHASATPDTAT